MEEYGPIRRRINSFTIKLEPFVNGLTNEEAITVRNTIESIIQSYFFEVQPWATIDNSDNSNDIGDDSTTGNNNDGAATTTTTTTAAAGSVTYVGLAQILENRQTEDNQGVQLTMNGLIYFAEGSQDIPDETELLEMMERQALSPEAVVEALKADFPCLQLVTVIETATATTGGDDTNTATAANNKPDDTTTTTATTTTTNIIPTLSPTVEIKAATTTTTTTLAPSPSPSLVVVVAAKPSVQEVPVTEGSSSSSSAIVPPVGQQQDTIIDGDDDDDSLNIAALAGGVAAGFVVLIAILGLFLIRTKRKSSSSKKNDSNDGQYLVNINSKDLFGSTSQDDWQLNSNSPTKTPRSRSKGIEDLQKSMDDLEEAIPQEQQQSPSEVSKTRTSGEQLEKYTSNKDIIGTSTTISYLSSFFTRVNPMQTHQQQEEVRSVSTNGEINNNNDDGGAGNNNTSNNNNNNDETDVGETTLSDFDDTVSIQPHIVTLQALESFEEQHKMTRQDVVFQKEMLESSFEKINNVAASYAGSSNLSYSSSSLDSSKGKSRGNSNYNNNKPSVPQKLVFNKNRHKELEEEKEEQRARYSMMPNPYFRRTYPGAAPGATVEDRSLPCALTPTDTTAAALARRTISPGSETGSYTGLGMIPKLSAPAWWSSSNGNSSLDNNRSPSSRSRSSRSSGSRRKSRGSSSSKDRRSSGSNKSSSAAATATAAYSDDDLAYSGDEENTFGVPESDGWDPADAELSSIGDAPDQDEINMILFHPQVTGGNNNKQSVPQSILNNTSNTTRKDSFKMTKRKSKSPTKQQAGASEYWNGANSVSSEESNVLKLDSSVSMEI
jgi:hypothetical protein